MASCLTGMSSSELTTQLIEEAGSGDHPQTTSALMAEAALRLESMTNLLGKAREYIGCFGFTGSRLRDAKEAYETRLRDAKEAYETAMRDTLVIDKSKYWSFEVSDHFIEVELAQCKVPRLMKGWGFHVEGGEETAAWYSHDRKYKITDQRLEDALRASLSKCCLGGDVAVIPLLPVLSYNEAIKSTKRPVANLHFTINETGTTWEKLDINLPLPTETKES